METNFQLGVKSRVFNYNLDRALKAAAKKAGQPLKQFCLDSLGVLYVTLNRYITFKGFPDEERALHIATVLGVTLESIFPLEIKDVRVMQPEVVTMDAGLYLEAVDQQPELEDGLGDAMQRVLATLNERERAILEYRFGLGDDKDAETLQEVGVRFGVTRDRIRQIEARALKKLRHSKRAALLRDYAPALN